MTMNVPHRTTDLYLQPRQSVRKMEELIWVWEPCICWDREVRSAAATSRTRGEGGSAMIDAAGTDGELKICKRREHVEKREGMGGECGKRLHSANARSLKNARGCVLGGRLILSLFIGRAITRLLCDELPKKNDGH